MNNEKAVQELLALQKRIEQTKQERARVEGELKALLKRLADEFGTSDVKAIEKKIAGMRAMAERLRKQVDAGLATLRKEMEK